MHPHVLYLHGFGSGPRSAKGAALGTRLRGAVASFAIPDLEAGDFFRLTMDAIVERAAAAADALPDDGRPLLVIGSSLGGYSAALMASRRRLPRLAGLLLIAPAFHFPDRWRERLGEAGVARWKAEGSWPFYHHGAERELPLGAAFLASCEALPGIPGAAGVPVAIVHGRQDETVDWRGSLAYAEADPRVELHLVTGDHRLTEPRHEELIAAVAADLIARLP
jgi:pimeloyl-ACP methyl ester carboxylesterase